MHIANRFLVVQRGRAFATHQAEFRVTTVSVLRISVVASRLGSSIVLYTKHPVSHVKENVTDSYSDGAVSLVWQRGEMELQEKKEVWFESFVLFHLL